MIGAGAEVVEMGRVICDGSMCFYIQDVSVLPEFRRRGLGQAIVDALPAWVREQSPAYVGLFATAGARDFYRRNGFTDRNMPVTCRSVKPGDDHTTGGFFPDPGASQEENDSG